MIYRNHDGERAALTFGGAYPVFTIYDTEHHPDVCHALTLSIQDGDAWERRAVRAAEMPAAVKESVWRRIRAEIGV